jgi:hypothetical protein
VHKHFCNTISNKVKHFVAYPTAQLFKRQLSTTVFVTALFLMSGNIIKGKQIIGICIKEYSAAII